MFVDRCTHIHVCIVSGGRWEHQLLFCYRRHKNSLRNALRILTVLRTIGPQSPGGPRTATVNTPTSTETLRIILSNDQPSQVSTYSFLSLSCSQGITFNKRAYSFIITEMRQHKTILEVMSEPFTSLCISFSISKKENVTYFIKWFNIFWWNALYEQSCRISRKRNQK